MVINNILLAHICDDVDNVNLYKINGDTCYVGDQVIGKVYSTLNSTNVSVYFKHASLPKWIDVRITIGK